MEESMIGKKVKYREETWEVAYVAEERKVILVQISVDVKMGAIRVDPIAVMAEKLKKVFGDGVRKALTGEGHDPCSGTKCKECPFRSDKLREAGFPGNCNSLVWHKPDLAVRLMDEWLAKRDKPKGKTYREDFLEKLPNATIESNGRPACCRDVMYKKRDWVICPKSCECSMCWNEVMPEDDNAEG